MSFEAPFSIVPLELATSRDLTLEEIRVLIALFSWRGKNTNVVWPKREALGQRCGYAPKKISEVTASLVKKGWLEKSGNGGRSTPSQYRITVPEQGTVPESETVPQSGNKTVPEQGNKTAPQSGEGKEQTKEQTREQTNKEARPKQAKPSSNAEDPPPPSSVEPDCIPPEVWKAFVDHRKDMKKPMTPYAAQLMAKKLAKFHARGIDVVDAIETSIRSRWSDIYEPRPERKTNGRTSYLDAVLSFDELGIAVPDIW